MNPRLRRILKWTLYPLFYAFAFVVFALWTFPYDRLKDRLVAEFNARQPAGTGTRIEIESMSGYWIHGIEAEGVKLIAPPPPPGEDGKPKEPRVMQIDHIHVSISLLRLVVGTKHIKFGGDVFGGTIEGWTSDADDARAINVEMEGVSVSDLPVLREVVGLPMTGALTGTVDLQLPEAKLSKAAGKIELKITDLTVGDGKEKIQNTIALPKLEAGELVLEAEATEGRLKIAKLNGTGKHVEIVSDGSIRLRDPLDASLAELSMRFKFTDAYKTKDETTKALLGEPGSSLPGLFDLNPKNKRAKRPDGFYAFRMTGPLAKLDMQPSPLGAAGGAGTPRNSGSRGFSPLR
jgi:type II secretion system protein N